MYRPGQAPSIPGGGGSQNSRQSSHEGGKIVSPTHRSPLPPDTLLFYSQDPSAAGRIMSMKNANAVIGNRIHDLPSFSSVPQPTALPHAPFYKRSYVFTFLTTVNYLLTNFFQEFRTTKNEHKVQGCFLTQNATNQQRFEINCHWNYRNSK
jgi:hypothetical protein